MVFQKIIRIFIACFVLQLMACSTTAIKFDPSTVSATDKIGVWSTYSRPKGFSGLSDVFVDSLKEQKNDVLKTVLDLKLHDVVEARFIQKASLAVNAKYQTINLKDIVVDSDSRPDLLATANSLGLDKVVIFNTAATVSEITFQYKFYWQPALEVDGKMLNVSDGKVLWVDSIKMAHGKIPRFEFSDTTFDTAFNHLAVQTVDRLLVGMHRTSRVNNNLHVFAGKGDLEKVKAEINSGENVNSIDIVGQTALMYASEQDGIEVVKYLVENGADVNMKSDAQGRGSALIYAAATNRITVMDYLLKNGADINATTYKKETALFWAAAKGHIQAVKLLLDNNADTKLRNKDGKTALDLAEDLNQDEILNLLVGK